MENGKWKMESYDYLFHPNVAASLQRNIVISLQCNICVMPST